MPSFKEVQQQSMRKNNNCCTYFLAVFAWCLIVSCAGTADVVGKWREVGKTATVVFEEDGRFRAVDNQGMAVRGTYTLHNNGAVRFTIDRQGFPPEIVDGKITRHGEELTLTSGDGSEVDRYKREK